MGGGATWYRVTRLSRSGEQDLFKVEDCFIKASSELPKDPPYRELYPVTTYEGVKGAMGEQIFNSVRAQILALTEENPIFEYRPYPRHFSP
jgi:hypothetical protein